LRLEDLGADMLPSASSKAKAKQAIQSRVFAVPPVPERSQMGLWPDLTRVSAQVTQSIADVFGEFDFMGSGATKPQSFGK
jgi:hypothetical protein